jgi:hypothetical protein
MCLQIASQENLLPLSGIENFRAFQAASKSLAQNFECLKELGRYKI